MTNRCEYKQKGCGGCPLLGKAYAEQLAQKQRRVEKLLGKFGPVEPILGMETPWHYRNKAIATFGTDPRGRLILGIYARGTHRVVPVQGCRLQNESLNQVMEAVLAAAKACRWTAYDEDKGAGLVRHVLLRHSRTTGQVLVTLVTPTPQLPGSRNFITRLRALAPQVSGVVQNLNPRRTSAVLGPQEKLLWGRPAVKDTLCGQEFLISSRSFYQVNPVQTERLYALALNAAALTGKERVVDAYCGIGTIGLCAAPHAGQVVGVELNPEAARDAAANARRNGAANARFYQEDATQWLTRQAAEGQKADVIFLDPPRAGSTPEFLRAAAAMRPSRMVYVSCDPATQARDLELLTRLGYRMERAWPVDLFPHTEHVETIVLLSKLNTKQHIEVELNLDELDLTSAESKATYDEIKAYVLEKHGLKVSSLYISQVKRKCGLDVGQNYNLSKKEDAKVPQCPPEKEAAIMDALKHFQMI